MGFRRFLISLRDVLLDMERCPKPVIVAVNGITLAGGLELALAADFIVMSSGARIGDGHARYGLVPGGGGTQRLPDAVGSRLARWLMYTAATLTAEEAQRGSASSSRSSTRRRSRRTSPRSPRRLAALSQPGLAFMKRMSVSRSVTVDGLDLEVEAAVGVIGGPDAREGVSAFLEKRDPVFTASI